MEDWSKKIWDIFDGSGTRPPPEGATTEELIKYMEKLTKETQDNEK